MLQIETAKGLASAHVKAVTLTNTIVRWTEFDRGGHYAAIEESALWTGEVRAFFAGL